jgi:molecular chaperone GrpE (heat shock protein)
MSFEQIKMNTYNELKIREMIKAFYEQNPACEIKLVSVYPQQNKKESCKCNTHMDIRGRCGFINNGKGFRKCRARVNTGYFHLTNDYETYKKLEKSKTEKQKKEIIRKFCHDILGLISLDDKNKIFEMYKLENKIESCECCDKPFNHPTKRNAECCDCVYNDDGTITLLKDWAIIKRI